MSQRFGLVLACAIGFGAPVSAADLFGAIAFSPSTGKVGGGWNFASKEDASGEAVTQCGVGDCASVVVFPSCGAVAVGDGYGMGFSADGAAAKAEETALANCSGYTANCLITMSFCNDAQ
ncbi:DUF4189 domain-containing protein [Rhodobacter sp. KR11]|jgi:hypothetical protein|uniref:DUF4189 domain-containing protein n=1 Tax=Rhodobacter sp. KR11 TaxID=2974588 RepID=UPI002223512E|nr:DUF4189 domain-containing protein [Rhodobacter sp. KR11]MCW1917636.1 DUF4189 domain-containing protein [Rhodobacter sp. KR11]